MKKRIIIVLSIVIFIFLVARLISNHFQGLKEEKQWYVEQLHFDFSGEVDTVLVFRRELGFIVFHGTRGSVDQSHENRLNEQLKYNGNLRFLVFEPNDKIEMLTRKPALYLPGDSVSINTEKDHILIYRKGQEISRNKIMTSLRGRPF